MTQFDFYLLNLSFRAPEGLIINDLRSSVEQLSLDCDFIRQNDEIIYRHQSIYEEILWQDYEVLQVLYTPEISEEFGRDYHYMLQVIIDHSKETNLENEEVLELLKSHTHDLVNGLLCLHPLEVVDEKYCVYCRNDWYAFHRHFLGTYPISVEWYASRCSIYFPELHFHSNIDNTLKTLDGDGIFIFSKVIVRCLTHLNDDFKSCLTPNNIPESLRKFSSICGFDTTNEGDLRRKEDLSFAFKKLDNSEEVVYCEPHIKFSKSDYSSDNKYYHNRIYFHVGKPDIADGKILVGHIGKHL